MSKPTNFNIGESLDVVWKALHGYQEACLDHATDDASEEWDDICTAMAWITDALTELNEND
jgi:hypothetical protein